MLWEETNVGKKFKTFASGAVPTERYMYVGKSISKAGLLRWQVFLGGKPAVIETLKEKYPLIEQLFVPITEIDKARQAVATKGTPLYLANQQIAGGEK